MWKRYVHPIRSENFWRSTNRERVILPSSQAKLRKNTLFIDQSAFSNFALFVITGKTFGPLKIRGFKKRNRNTLNESRPLIKRFPFTEGHISLEKEIRAEVYKTSEGNPQVNLVPEIYCFLLTKVLGK